MTELCETLNHRLFSYRLKRCGRSHAAFLRKNTDRMKERPSKGEYMGEAERGDDPVKDDQIIALFFARSQQALTELDRKYGAVCSAVARNILKNPQDAEECVNDAYLGVWNTIPPQHPNPLLTYLCRIVRNRSIKRYHANTAQKRNSSYDVALDELTQCISTTETVESALSAKELTRLLDAFLAELDQRNRMLFVRRYWYADDIPALAERFHMSRNSVSIRLSRIRKKLRDYLQKEGVSL